MTRTLRFLMLAAALIAAAALAAVAAGRVPMSALGWGGAVGLAGAAVVLVCGVAAMRAARRRLGPRRAATGDEPAASGADGSVDITFLPGSAEDATVLHDSARRREDAEPLGPPGEAERQAAAILRQIERMAGPAARPPRPGGGADPANRD